MGLTSSLFTGLTGLDVNQTKLHVVGNNIANVNTVAFKSSRTLFKPQFYVTDTPGAPPSTGFGGTNPSQRGLGASVSAIEKDWTTGAIESTGKSSDMAIDGSGFFVVNTTAGQRFTRDGSFDLNSNNELVTSTGDFLQGYGVDANGEVIPGTLQNIRIPLGEASIAEATTKMTMVGNLDASGEAGTGASILLGQSMTVVGGASAPTAATALDTLALSSASGAAIFAGTDTLTFTPEVGGRKLPPVKFEVTDPVSGTVRTLGDLMTFMQQKTGIDTTATVAGAPTPGMQLVSDSATSVQLGIVGNVGAANALALPGASLVNQSGITPLAFAAGSMGPPNQASTFESDPNGESVHTTLVGYDSLGQEVRLDVTAVLETKADTGNVWRFYVNSGDDTDPDTVVGNGTLTFDSFGKLKSADGNQIQIQRNDTGAGTPVNITLDFSGMTSLASTSSNMVMSNQDGSPIGALSDYAIGGDGTITGTYTNGRTRTLGQVAVANFNNPQGLIDRGANMFDIGSSSGAAIITPPLSLGAGAIRAGSLEMSNVDLSKEFINMIIATTGFSAASRVISTSDRLMTELLNTSR